MQKTHPALPGTPLHRGDSRRGCPESPLSRGVAPRAGVCWFVRAHCAHLVLILCAALTLTAARAVDDPIKVGEYGAFSGKEAAFGISARKGAILAFEEANA